MGRIGRKYVAYLLTNPPKQPIHAVDLAAKIREIYRNQLGLQNLVDPVTAKGTSWPTQAPHAKGAKDAKEMRVAGHEESSPNGESEGLLQKHPFALSLRPLRPSREARSASLRL